MTPVDAVALWEQATKHLKEVLHPDIFQRWIAVIEAVSLDGETLHLSVDNDFYQTWLEEHYLSLICDAVAAVCGTKPKVVFSVKAQRHAPEAAPAATIAPQQPAPAPAKEPTRERQSGRSSRSPDGAALNEKFIFESFIVGSCNTFAHAASLAVAQAPGRAYNPLFIYGKSGLGKTHLMQAIGHYVFRNSRAIVRYITAEAFVNEYINALQSRSPVLFRRKYRNVDLLLIDDIHFLGGKEGLQEEFFHTFNTLFDAHKQIVMTSDRSASEIVGLQQRLVSRFEWGLVTEVEPPDLETRIAILRNKLRQMNASLPDDTLLFIAERVRTNVRRLEGALTRVVSYAALSNTKQPQANLEHLLKDLLSEEREDSLTINAIKRAVAQHYDVRVTDITSKRRPAAIALPRQVAMYLCRRMTDSSLPAIASEFEKTHATVLHACKRIDARLKTDETFRRKLQIVAKSLGTSL
ncbi:MAG: chromosomal replication initiator protein DnaA [bacterium]